MSMFFPILLPLIETITANFAKKYPKFHQIVLIKIIIVALIAAISLPISNEIYLVNLGIMQLKFMSDIYSYCFGILVCVIWFLTAIYSYSYTIINIKRRKVSDLFRYLSLSIFAVLGNGYAADLWTLFFFYVLLIVFTSPLIVQNIGKAAIKAQKIYLFTHLATSAIFFLPAIILVQKYVGNVDFVAHDNSFLNQNHHLASLLLLLFVFGISKNCLLPFHNWITRSTVAPNPVSALLHSVAAVKSGSIAIIKIVVYVFGLDCIKQLTVHFWSGGWIFYLCGITAIYAAYRAWKTTDIKKRFAYSTISQLSYIMSSVMIATKLAIMGATLHIISHSLCKVALFYIAGILTTIYNARSTKDVARIAPHLKILIGCIAFCGASIIGLPFLPGSFGKDYMIISEFQTHHYASLVFLVTGSVINVLYIYPVVKAAFFNNYDKNDLFWKEKQHLKIPQTMQIAIAITIFLAILMSYFISPITNFLMFYDV